MTPQAPLRPASNSIDPALADLVEELTAKFQAGEAVDAGALLRAHPEHAEQLRQLLPALEMLVGLSGSREESGPAPDGVAGTLGDFRILREVGRGGMGVVYEAEQISLGRRVALKVLPFAATMDPRHLQRFHNEARAAASLEHPHIVPVYAVGCERGVHFYAMKFIDGQSLAAIVDAQRTGNAGSPCNKPTVDYAPATPADPTTPTAKASTEGVPRGAAAFRQIAEWGIQAAEALEHAHSVGIVHRDIKPANLMIDAHGALWVTDFGLARTAADAGLTMTGDVLGTLRYMSPEQALAKHGLMDHRTDVYSLGATLYEVLTLRPVLDGSDRQDLLRQIANEEPKPPRTVSRAIPVELETIILKALEKNPADRYATAEELADDLRRFLEARPIRAKRPTLLQCLRKWGQRHRHMVGATALFLALVVVGLAVSVFLIWGEKEQTKTALALAEKRTQEARRAVDKMYTQVAERWLADEPGLEEVQREFLEDALRFYLELAEERSSDPDVQLEVARAYYRVGNIRARLDRPDGDAYRRAYTLLTKLVADWPERREYRHELVQTTITLGCDLTNGWRFREAEECFTRALDLATALASKFPHEPAYQRDVVEAHRQLGRALYYSGRIQEAERTFRQALRLQEIQMAKGPGEANDKKLLALLHGNLGIVLRYNGRLPEAEEHLDAALALYRELLAKYPRGSYFRHQVANYQGERAQVLALSGRFQEAEETFNGSLDSFQKLKADYPAVLQPCHDLGYNSNNLGVVLAQTGRPREAEKAYRQALEWQAKMVGKEPFRPRWQELAVIHHNLAWLLVDSPDPQVRDLKQALEHAEKAVDLEPGATDGPDVNTANCRKLPNLWNTLAVAHYRGGDYRAALRALHKAVDLQGGGNGFDCVFLSMAHWQLGDKEEARKWYGKAIQGMEKNAAQDDELNGFRAEAATLLGIEKPQTPKVKEEDPGKD